MKKKLNDISLEKNGWKVTSKSATVLAENKNKMAFNNIVVDIKREVQGSNTITGNIKERINTNFSNLESVIKNKTVDVKGIERNIKDVNLLLKELIVLEGVKKNWKFEVKRDYSGKIQEVIAREVR